MAKTRGMRLAGQNLADNNIASGVHNYRKPVGSFAVSSSWENSAQLVTGEQKWSLGLDDEGSETVGGFLLTGCEFMTEVVEREILAALK